MGKRMLIKLIYPCLKLYWFLVRPHTFGVQCVIRHCGALLLIRNTYGRQRWTFPGGGMRSGETPEEAVRREVREEVGLHLQYLREIGAFTSTADYKRDHVVVFAGAAQDCQVTLDPAEILEAQWFPPTQLPRLSTSAERILVIWQRAAHDRPP
jgi:ADP-ribose pyrophosphatase YjhB (NUDIX family)